MEKIFDIPGFTYFQEKNIYTGSVNNIFNYKISPGEKLNIIIWKGKFCLAKTPEEDIVAQEDFEMNSDGLTALKQWLKETYETNK